MIMSQLWHTFMFCVFGGHTPAEAWKAAREYRKTYRPVADPNYCR